MSLYYLITQRIDTTMEGAVKMLLELLAEEHVKCGRLKNELAEETAIRIAAENKNLTLLIGKAAPHETPSYDTHSGLEKINAIPGKIDKLPKLNIRR